MKTPNRVLLLALVLACLPLNVVVAQSGTVEQIEIQGLYRMTREAFLHALGIKVGDTYDEARIRARFRELWKLRLFEDITVEAETGAGGGRVLVFKVKERPVLSSVTYEDNKVASRTAIEDRLRELEIPLQLGKPLDMGIVFRTATAVRDLLSEKGFLDAEVEAVVQPVTETTRAVHFRITPGGKTRIRKITFVGNEIHTDRRLRGELELTQERKWYWPWSGKNLYHPGKWDQDVSKVRELYLNEGYLDVVIGAPRVEIREKAAREPEAESPQTAPPAPAESAPPAEPTPDAQASPKARKKAEKQRRKAEKKAREEERRAKKVKRWVHLTVPVQEGSQYTTGEVSISGNEVFPDELLKAMVVLREGEILRNGLLEMGVERIRNLYEDKGHLYATVVRRIERRPEEKIADVEVVVDEDEPYYVARVEFTGNTATHDRVLRREMLLNEGELFSRTKLRFSQQKINQLGYFQVPDEPVIEPVEGENRVKIRMLGEERGRNEIQVGGGYSGLEGAFFNGVYSTRNFLGRGQIVSAALQIGGRSNRYTLSFQEPWFMGRPYLFGFSVFRQDLDYGASLRSTSRGGSLMLGRRVGRWGNVSTSYRWQDVSSETVLVSATGATGSTIVGTENKISSITPAYSFSTVNNPYRPSAGRAFSMALQVAGGPLGGDTSFLKPIARFTTYKRIFRKSFVALHLEAGWVREWGEGSNLNASNIAGIPRYERFWLGGDTLGPRVFETRTITPLRYVELDDDRNIVSVLGDPRYVAAEDLVTSGGIPVLIEAGGDRYYLLQSEYVFSLNEQADLAFFVDVGDALFEDQPWGFDTARVSAGVELRFHLPIFPVPLRLIYGVPVRKLDRDRTSNFTFSIGRSF